jgi:hypothetical protein
MHLLAVDPGRWDKLARIPGISAALENLDLLQDTRKPMLSLFR